MGMSVAVLLEQLYTTRFHSNNGVRGQKILLTVSYPREGYLYLFSSTIVRTIILYYISQTSLYTCFPIQKYSV